MKLVVYSSGSDQWGRRWHPGGAKTKRSVRNDG